MRFSSFSSPHKYTYFHSVLQGLASRFVSGLHLQNDQPTQGMAWACSGQESRNDPELRSGVPDNLEHVGQQEETQYSHCVWSVCYRNNKVVKQLKYACRVIPMEWEHKQGE